MSEKQNTANDADDREIVISVKHVSKRYEMYERPRLRLQQMIFGRWKKYYEEFWALHDVSFDVHKGDCVGIIGRNGSGKSTILQIIAGTLQPTEGEVVVKPGIRIAALLELGSGFNPEFTGRENVFLNASILGLKHEDTEKRFKEIEEFAGIGEFIDQPVKTYSSGMMVRLAFAVQVMIDPDLLIVDEALAVGDAMFQQKCYQRIRKLRDSGTTILFVSHAINTVQAICNKVVYLVKGKVDSVGDTAEITERYFSANPLGGGSEAEAVLRSCMRDENILPVANIIRDGKIPFRIDPDFGKSDTSRIKNPKVEITALDILNPSGVKTNCCHVYEEMTFAVHFQAKEDFPAGLRVGIFFKNDHAALAFLIGMEQNNISLPELKKGDRYVVTFKFKINLAPQQKFFLKAHIRGDLGGESFYYVDSVALAGVIEVLPRNAADLKCFGGVMAIDQADIQVNKAE